MNKVILVGNLARDPELSTTPSGVAVCRMTIAVSRKYTNSEGNRETDFINIVIWRTLAENCAKFLKKGSKAGVVGTLQTRSYDDKDGVKRYITEVVAEDVEFLSPKNGGDFGGDFDSSTNAVPQRGKKAELEPIEDDDLPF